MSLLLHSDHVAVYKHESTGILALCQEVVDFAASEEFVRRNLDPDSASFSRVPGGYVVSFYPKD